LKENRKFFNFIKSVFSSALFTRKKFDNDFERDIPEEDPLLDLNQEEFISSVKKNSSKVEKVYINEIQQ
jgi:hypothetical protein